jgi:predicted dehydrogenase
MDYTTQNTMFKIRKALRYVRLYGVRRTLIKIKGQYHMKKVYSSLPAQMDPPEAGGHVGLIGCGSFAFSNIAYYLKKNYGRVIRAAMDIDIHKAASLFEAYNLRYYTDDAEKIIHDPAIDLVYIASNHASHAEYAIQALEAGKNVHIEKPHVVREDQLERLCAAMARSKRKVRLGFNRPNSRIGNEIKRHLDSQSGPSMFNWFIAGHEISPDHWYFKEEEGGRILGNLCHWTDFVFQLVAPDNRYPITITPTRGQKSDCDIAVTFVFGDESIAAITFSAKGHTFEGVRERFAAHRGDVLISMDDFKDLTVEVVDKKYKVSPLFRDHGHELNITSSYGMVHSSSDSMESGCTLDYVWETAELFLRTRQALEENRAITLHPYDDSRLKGHLSDY